MSVPVRFSTTSDGVRIAWSAIGTGPTLVFIRGWISHLELWWEDPTFRAYFERLARHFRLVRYDARANGLSDRSPTQVDLRALCSDLEAVIDAQPPGPLVLYASTFGGPIASMYAATHPERVDRLILDGSFARGSDLVRSGQELLMSNLLALLRFDTKTAFAMLSYNTDPEPGVSHDARVSRMLRSISGADAARLYALIANLDVTDFLQRISAPTLVLHREHSRAVPFEAARHLASLLADGRLVSLPGRAHNSWEECPDVAAAAVGEFLGVDLGLTADAGRGATSNTAPVLHERTVQRRLAGILSADVVGYSTLMANDELSTMRSLAEFRSAIAHHVQEHGGRVVDAVGDNVLAEFPSVVEAVDCAVEVQRGQEDRNSRLAPREQMRLRIGINLGDVIVDGERIVGDGVNIAARLQTLAPPGGICISGTTFDQIDGKLGFAFENIGEQHFKNLPKPLRAYCLRAAAQDESERPSS